MIWRVSLEGGMPNVPHPIAFSPLLPSICSHEERGQQHVYDGFACVQMIMIMMTANFVLLMKNDDEI
jgi:hypothetical protein